MVVVGGCGSAWWVDVVVVVVMVGRCGCGDCTYGGSCCTFGGGGCLW